MGLFDFFRRKPKPDPVPQPAESSAGDLDSPRCHHYTLAHVALRQVALTRPVEFLAVLASRDATRFLSDLLRQVSANCRGREDRPDFSVDDITVHTVRAGGYPCAVIEMPRARAVAEAHMVAAVVLADPNRPPADDEEPRVRYFTLEKGMTFGGPPRTVLCEWSDEAHMNYGDGPPAEVPAFVAAIAAKLAGR
jgi:hypothetical protein